MGDEPCVERRKRVIPSQTYILAADEQPNLVTEEEEEAEDIPLIKAVSAVIILNY